MLKWRCPNTGRVLRKSTGTDSLKEANRQARQLQAELIAGTHRSDGEYPWDEFRSLYSEHAATALAPHSRTKAESVLNLVDQIMRPKRIADIANREALKDFRDRLLGKPSSRTKQPRSPNTVRSIMRTLMAALRWGHKEAGVIESVPAIGKVNVSGSDPMRGRPLTDAEFDAMLAAVEPTVGANRANEWRNLLCGLVWSGLRLGEILDLHWTDDSRIKPAVDGGWWVLAVPAASQKNRRDSTIPVPPALASFLEQITNRTGWVFNPTTARGGRPTPGTACRIVSAIGERSGVVVKDTGGAPQYPTAHDLRRTCAQRMLAAGISPLTVQRIMRHSSLSVTMAHYARAVAADDARELQAKLGHTLGHTPPGEPA